MKEIDKLAWLYIKDKRLLLARSKGNDTYYIPGGKREEGESDQQALVREIQEELAINLAAETIKLVGTFKAQAHGKPEGVMVKMTCYSAEFTGEVQASAEIEEVKWVAYGDEVKCSAVTQIILDYLKQQRMIAVKNDFISRPLPLTKYQWILFDADDTLFHFDAFAGLKRMFSTYTVDFTESDYREYQALNKALWQQFQKSEITAQDVKQRRFDKWATKLQVSSADLNAAFLSAMADICSMLEGAVSLLESLRGKVKLGIVTNGFTQLQEVRLKRTGLREHFEVLVVSEEVGFAKPHKGIFDHALSLMGNPTPDQVLMVGDTLESDILGGINASFDTCWLNSNNKPMVETIVPKYQVSSLTELENFLLGKSQTVSSAVTPFWDHSRASSSATSAVLSDSSPVITDTSSRSSSMLTTQSQFSN